MPPERWILLDSNCYFRLARSIHPLLNAPIYANGPCLGVISQLDEEYHRGQQRLKSKFFWITQSQYSENRNQNYFKAPRDKSGEIENAFYFMRETAREMKLSTSDVDIQLLAHGYVLGITIATDDTDMLILAKEYEVICIKTLDLLNSMLKDRFITFEKVKEIASYWKYQCDLPAKFAQDFRRLFHQNMP
jgi:hypothetical protein